MVIFALFRLAGNALLIYAYNDNYQDLSYLSWGMILQSIGFSFLLNSGFFFYGRAASGPNASLFRGGAKVLKLLHVTTLVALILGITGASKADYSKANASQPTLLKVADILFLGAALAFAALCLLTFRRVSQHPDSRIIMICLVIALPFLLVRSVYVLYAVFQTTSKNVWAQLVLQFCTETIVFAIYMALGILVDRAEPLSLERSANDEEAGFKHESSSQPSFVQQQHIPINYAQYTTPPYQPTK